MSRHRKIYKADRLILILVFGLAIYIPFLTGIIQKDKVSSGVEKRNLVTRPAAPRSIEELVSFPARFNEYYSDHFGLREPLTRRYFKLSNKLGRQSSVDDVTVGQDDWLFLGSMRPGYTGYGDPIGDAMNVNLFTEKELEDFTSSVMAIKNWLNKQGIEYIYVIAPNKHTIYFDKLPNYISKKNTFSATDQLVDHLRNNTDITVIDLRPALLAAKKTRQLYFKSDTHWNHYGANIAQFTLMKEVHKLFPDNISPTLLSNEQFLITTKQDGDLAKLANIETYREDAPEPVFEGGCTPVIETDTDISGHYRTSCSGQSLDTIVFGDSFFWALKPYFSRHFHRFTFVQEEIKRQSLQHLIEKDKPDIVIDEVVERELPYIPSNSGF